MSALRHYDVKNIMPQRYFLGNSLEGTLYAYGGVSHVRRGGNVT